MANNYDAIVIGGGHNGLVAGGLPRPAGLRTVVLEAGTRPAGRPTPSTPWPEHPDFKVTTLSYVMSLMPPTILRDLHLERHGYKVCPMGPYYQAWPGRPSLQLYPDDARKQHEEISKFSKKTPRPCRSGTPGSTGWPTCWARC